MNDHGIGTEISDKPGQTRNQSDHFMVCGTDIIVNGKGVIVCLVNFMFAGIIFYF